MTVFVWLGGFGTCAISRYLRVFGSAGGGG
jgi:hypothetical protein